MKDEANRLPRIGGRLGALAFLLTLTLGSAAQTTLPWSDTAQADSSEVEASLRGPATQPVQVATSTPQQAPPVPARVKPAAPPQPPDFDVAKFEECKRGVAEITRCILCIRSGVWPQRLHDVEETESIIMQEQRIHGKDEDQAPAGQKGA